MPYDDLKGLIATEKSLQERESTVSEAFRKAFDRAQYLKGRVENLKSKLAKVPGPKAKDVHDSIMALVRSCSDPDFDEIIRHRQAAIDARQEAFRAFERLAYGFGDAVKGLEDELVKSEEQAIHMLEAAEKAKSDPMVASVMGGAAVVDSLPAHHAPQSASQGEAPLPQAAEGMEALPAMPSMERPNFFEQPPPMAGPLGAAPSAMPELEVPPNPSPSAVPAPQPPARQERINLEVVVDYQSDSQFYAGFSANISEGGLFIATVNTLPIGTKTSLHFQLPGGHQSDAFGVVQWLREYNPLDADTSPGMGIRFTQLDEDSRRAIEDFLAYREPLFYDEEMFDDMAA